MMESAKRMTGWVRGVAAGLALGAGALEAGAAGRMAGISTTNTYMQYYGNDFSATNLAALAQYDVVVLDPNVSGCTPATVAYLKSNGVDYVLAYISIGEDPALAPWVVHDGLGPVRYVNGQVVQSTGGVYNAVTSLTVNGNLSDWEELTYFGPDPAETFEPIDWQDGWFAHSAGSFYLAYRTYGAVNTFNWGYTVYLDTDLNRNTGFRGGGDQFSIGANYMVQGATVYQYTGSGIDWSWNFVGVATSAISGGTVEMAFPKSWVGNPANNAVNLLFFGDNASQGGSYVDVYPNNALAGPTGGKITYPLFIASFYVDQYWNGSGYTSDGHPDLNGEFFSRFVNPNADWRYVLNEQRIGGVASNPNLALRSIAGLKQIAGARVSDSDTARTNNFGFDGFFLDTLDTASPFSVERAYPWTVFEMTETVKFIHDTYTNKIVFANRGVFYFNPILVNGTFNIRPYDYNIRPYIHALLFESYLLDSSFSTNISPYFNDNKNNYAPKIIAEANRPDGFTTFCLDYQQNRGTNLYNRAIQEAIVTNGWVFYLSPDGAIDKVGSYVRLNPPAADTLPPVWDSTAGLSDGIDPTNRVGLQSAKLGDNPGEVILHWDVARDQTPPIRYDVIRATNAAFTGTLTWYSNVSFTVGDGWGQNPVAAPANKAVLTGVPLGTNYFRVRARDSSTIDGRAESNTVTHMVVVTVNEVSNPQTTGIVVNGSLADWNGLRAFGPDANDISGASNPIDWLNVWMAHDLTRLYIAFTNDGAVTINAAVNFYLDVDANRDTGFRGGGNEFPVGADYLLQGVNLFKYTGTGLDFSWSFAGPISWSTSGNTAETSLSRQRLGNPHAVTLFCYGDNPGVGGTTADLLPDNAFSGGKLTYVIRDTMNPFTNVVVNGILSDWTQHRSFGSDPDDVAATNQVDFLASWMGHNTNRYFIAIETDNAVTYNTRFNVFFDTDARRTTGFRGGADDFSIGADFRLSQDTLQRYTGTGLNESWTNVGTVTRATTGRVTEISFPQTWLGTTDVVNLFFRGSNSATAVDFMPDYVLVPGGGGRFFTYRKNDITNAVATNAITLDGNLADWGTLRPFFADPQDATATGDTLDWNLAWMAHSSSNLFLAFQNFGAITQIDTAWHVFFDTDGNRLTGYRNGDIFPLGADYMLQGLTLYQYTGSGLNWSWSSVGTPAYAWSGTNAELFVPRSWLGNPRLIKALYYGDNPAVGGSTTDLNPDTAVKAGGAGMFHTYRLP